MITKTCIICANARWPYYWQASTGQCKARRRPYITRDMAICEMFKNASAEWTSMAERLPAPGEHVLVAASGVVFEAFIDANGKWKNYTGGLDLSKTIASIAYWRHLPEEPQCEQEV